MPISRSSKKSLRKSAKNRKSNHSLKLKLKEILRKLSLKPSAETAKDVQSALDKAVKAGIYHKNKVARLKSQLSKKLATPEGNLPAVAKKAKKVVKKKAVKKVSKKTLKKM